MIVIVGLSHHTAPIAVRERLAVSAEGAELLVTRLLSDEAVREAFLVSTCNRVELIAVPALDDAQGQRECREACVKALFGKQPIVRDYIYEKTGIEAVRHLVCVASSLDSLVVGEPQILGQLKQGFERSLRLGGVGSTLHRVMSRALRGAKRVRSETLIGVGQVSVPSIAVELAEQIFGALSAKRAVLIGSGDMGQTVARLLKDSGAELVVLGRNMERVAPVAQAVGGQAGLMSSLREELGRADVVVSSTSATHCVITRDDLKSVSKKRRGRHLFLIDLAVPRDIEEGAGELDGVFLYNVDDLSQVASESAETRKKEAERAHALVERVVEDWQRWSDAQQATPTIKALRAKFQAAMNQELERSLRGRLRDLSADQKDAIEKMMSASLNRMLHAPSVRLREQASTADGWELEDLARALTDLFELQLDSVIDSTPPGRASISARASISGRASGRSGSASTADARVPSSSGEDPDTPSDHSATSDHDGSLEDGEEHALSRGWG